MHVQRRGFCEEKENRKQCSGGGLQFSLGGGDLVNVFMCLWVLIINVRMGLKCVYKVIHGITLWDPFLKCGTILWDRDQEIPPNRIRH